MPPKKVRNTTENTSLDFNVLDASEGAPFIESSKQKASRKRAPTRKSYAAVVLAIDVGSTSSLQSVPGETETDLQRSLQIADWVISRKLFNNANDQFSLLFFGHECTTNDNHPNVYVHNTEFGCARVEWLHVLKNEIQPNPKCPGDYVAALFDSLKQLKIQMSRDEITEASVTLISNFCGLTSDDQVSEVLDSVEDAINITGAKLFIIGPDLEKPPISKSQELGIKFIRALNSRVNLVSYNFQESLSKLAFFIPNATSIGHPFNFKLGKDDDFTIHVQMYVKNQKVVSKERFAPVSCASTTDKMEQPKLLTKVRSYETMADLKQTISKESIDSAPDTTFTSTSTLNKGLSDIPTGKSVQKDDLVQGYRYGSTFVMFNEEIQMMSDVPHEGRQLQLIQFAKKEKILPQILVSSPRYILPYRNRKESLANRESNQKAFNMLYALTHAMMNRGVVALCRYAYNKNSNPQLTCLIPKITKKEGYPILIHYLMPFRDDFRYFDFPPIFSGEITDYQKELIDEYFNNLMLCDKDGNNELLKKRSIHDPRNQHRCMILREKALNPEQPVELSFEDKRELLKMLEPPKYLLENAKHVISTMKDEFSLQLQSKSNPFHNKEGNDETTGDVGTTLTHSRPTGDDSDHLRPILEALDGGKNKLQKENRTERDF